jgi:hypothetical protein
MLDGSTQRPFFPRRANGEIIMHMEGDKVERDLDGMATEVHLDYQV